MKENLNKQLKEFQLKQREISTEIEELEKEIEKYNHKENNDRVGKYYKNKIGKRDFNTMSGLADFDIVVEENGKYYLAEWIEQNEGLMYPNLGKEISEIEVKK